MNGGIGAAIAVDLEHRTYVGIGDAPGRRHHLSIGHRATAWKGTHAVLWALPQYIGGEKAVGRKTAAARDRRVVSMPERFHDRPCRCRLDMRGRTGPDVALCRRPLERFATVKKVLAFLRRMGFDYSCFRIFAYSLHISDAEADTLPGGYRFAELSSAELSNCPISELQACEGYGGPGSYLFAILDDNGNPACVQCIWFGDRYQQRAFWPLGFGEAASMNLVTAPLERHKGLATLLKKHSAEQMRRRGFARLYSRIWWTNTASLRVSEKAGWSHVGTVLEVVIPGMRKPIRIIFGKQASPKPAAR